MNSLLIPRSFAASFLSVLLSCILFFPATSKAIAFTAPYVILSEYSNTLTIGTDFYLTAVTSGTRSPSFKSSNSRIASVNAYGLVTAKKPGTCKITVKADSAEAACKIKVKKTAISATVSSLSLERGQTYTLNAISSNQSPIQFSSNRKSVATVDDSGTIIACKPGTAVITMKADTTKKTCKVTVKKPAIKLNRLALRLYRCQQFQLDAQISSGLTPVWRSNRSSVATVSDTGLVMARKHGIALITVKIDGVSKICEVEVLSPEITLDAEELTLKKGKTCRLDYTTSSGNAPVFKSSKSSVAKVDQLGNITARSTGTAIISVTDDGTRETCIVHVG